ncbi:hypothetical protein, partial [Mesorhizobium sp.]|uniref:hypothetical protein n=1 Tax=Mesorhizobium sp. TaxID=1871066 RepID=UPI0025795A97
VINGRLSEPAQSPGRAIKTAEAIRTFYSPIATISTLLHHRPFFGCFLCGKRWCLALFNRAGLGVFGAPEEIRTPAPQIRSLKGMVLAVGLEPTNPSGLRILDPLRQTGLTSAAVVFG